MQQPTAPRSLVPVGIALAAGALLALSLTRLFGATDAPPVQRGIRAPAQVATAPLSEHQAARKNRETAEELAQAEQRRQQVNADLEQRAAGQLQSFAGQYAAEAVDPAWATAKEQVMLEASISEQIRKADAMPNDFDVACRASICRLSADFASRSIAEDWVILFSTAMGGGMQNISFRYTIRPDASTHVEGYGVGRK